MKKLFRKLNISGDFFNKKEIDSVCLWEVSVEVWAVMQNYPFPSFAQFLSVGISPVGVLAPKLPEC